MIPGGLFSTTVALPRIPVTGTSVDWALTRPRRAAVKAERMVAERMLAGYLRTRSWSKGEGICFLLVPGTWENKMDEAAGICSPAGDRDIYEGKRLRKAG